MRARPIVLICINARGSEFRLSVAEAEAREIRSQLVIPGRREAANPESRYGFGDCFWIPGPRLRRGVTLTRHFKFPQNR